MGEYSHVVEQKGWAEIIIDRPERRNALVPPLFSEMTASLKALDQRDDISSIVLRGEGGYFCSGIDLKALQNNPPADWADMPDNNARSMHLALYHCRKPIIAGLEKFAINAGASLALACDLIIGGENAFLQIGEIQQGVGIPMNAAWLKIKTTEATAARLSLMGDRVTSPELLNLGLITECVEDAQVVARCHEIAERLASFPQGATATIKAALVAQRGIDNPEAFFPIQANPGLLTAKMVKN